MSGKENKESETFYLPFSAHLTAHEVALAMMGGDCFDDDAIAPEQRKKFEKIKKVITRNLQVVDNKPQPKKTYKRYLVLCAAFRLQDENTPKEVRENINNAIITMTKSEKNWEAILTEMGGDELCQAGKRLRYHKRGLHKRDDEERNNLKIIWLLVQLLQEHGKANYRDNITAIHRDLLKLCKNKNISTEGVKKSSFFNRIKEAKNLIDFDVID
ncbi:hypothetical protein AB0R35_001288 [Salmonella enterica subsp. enterica serovar Bareilly]